MEKGFKPTRVIVPVDHERGTLAVYARCGKIVPCGSFADDPECYCVRG